MRLAVARKYLCVFVAEKARVSTGMGRPFQPSIAVGVVTPTSHSNLFPDIGRGASLRLTCLRPRMVGIRIAANTKQLLDALANLSACTST